MDIGFSEGIILKIYMSLVWDPCPPGLPGIMAVARVWFGIAPGCPDG